MERRSWPWKKKSSEKNQTDKPVAILDAASISLSKAASLGHEDCKKVNYVQISLDSYKHLSSLEDEVSRLKSQVSSLECQVKDLNGKLSAAHLEINLKEQLAKEHAKVAEEAVSGWEKADAEALALKQQLESVTLLKLAADDRVSQLDGALKECMRQIRNVKEERERNLQEEILAKTKQWDKMRLDFEGKVTRLEQQLLQAAAENVALSKSLQEHMNAMMTVNEEKSQVEAEIEMLKQNVEMYEKNISSLTYELHMVSKELEIRNQEKDMSLKAAEVSNKQHLEDARKISKLEAECQRLRGLIRKKLPGPAALAQMKLEVESSARNYSEPWLQKSTVKNHASQLSRHHGISNDNPHQCPKQTEFPTKQLLEMEEEINRLRKALSERNAGLQGSRNTSVKTVGRLKSLEAQNHVVDRQKMFAISNSPMDIEDISGQTMGTQSNSTSITDDGIDDEGSSIESYGPLISNQFQSGRDTSIDKSNKEPHVNGIRLMDDFLEMEKLACSSNESCVTSSVFSCAGSPHNGHVECALVDATKDESPRTDQDLVINSSGNKNSANPDPQIEELKLQIEDFLLCKLLSKIDKILESYTEEVDVKKVLGDIKQAVGIPVPLQNLEKAVSQIHEFVLSLGNDAAMNQGASGYKNELGKKLKTFSSSYKKLECNHLNLVDFVIELSNVFNAFNQLKSYILSEGDNIGDSTDCECIDKVTLLESKVANKMSVDPLQNECGNIAPSDIEPHQGALPEENYGFQFGSNVAPGNFAQKEDKQLKSDGNDLLLQGARCTQELETTKLQLLEADQLLVALKSQLASSQKCNSLAEVQLKCMTESYKSLEMRARGLEAEVKLLQEKIKKLEKELSEEKHQHQETLAGSQDLQWKIQGSEGGTVRLSSTADFGTNGKQDKEASSAAQKLLDCQETIYLLSKQLKALHPYAESKVSEAGEKHHQEEKSV